MIEERNQGLRGGIVVVAEEEEEVNYMKKVNKRRKT